MHHALLENPVCLNYNTLQLTFKLLDDRWEALSNSYSNYDKCRLVCRQVIGYLQLTLPGIDRMAFSRAFQDKNRTLDFIWADGRFPDAAGGDLSNCVGLGFDELIVGECPVWGCGHLSLLCYMGVCLLPVRFSKFMSNKNFKLTELMQHCQRQTTGCVIS